MSLTSTAQAIMNSNRITGEVNVSNSDETILMIHARLAECCTVDQVIDAVYPDYCLAFREDLLTYTSWCEKLEMVISSKDRLTAALGAQTVPPRLRVKAPRFQFSKAFEESNSEAASAARNGFSAATASFQEAINAASLAGKNAEVNFWMNKCDPAYLLETLSEVIASVWNERKESFKIPTITYSEGGKAAISNWVYSSQKITERDTLIRAIPLLGSRLREIVSLRHRAVATKIEQEKVSSFADVGMADRTKPGPSIQSLIDKGLDARFKKLNLVPGKKAVSRFIGT